MSDKQIVMLPGLLCDDAVWRDQREALAPVRCFVPDYGSIDSIPTMAQYVLNALGPGRWTVIGHSMGGRVALEIARQAPERLESLVLMDTGLDPLAEGQAGLTERDKRYALLERARQHGMRAMGKEWARGMVHPDHLDTPVFEEILDMIDRKTPEIFGAQIKALLDRPNAQTLLPTVQCPVLLMCGRQDNWSPLDRHERMQAALPGAELVVIEDSGHMTTMEQPDAVTKALQDWLSR